jgi:hypothetical protein
LTGFGAATVFFTSLGAALAFGLETLGAGDFLAGAFLAALADRTGCRFGADARFFAAPLAPRIGLRLDDDRAFAARRNFAMPGCGQ